MGNLGIATLGRSWGWYVIWICMSGYWFCHPQVGRAAQGGPVYILDKIEDDPDHLSNQQLHMGRFTTVSRTTVVATHDVPEPWSGATLTYTVSGPPPDVLRPGDSFEITIQATGVQQREQPNKQPSIYNGGCTIGVDGPFDLKATPHSGFTLIDAGEGIATCAGNFGVAGHADRQWVAADSRTYTITVQEGSADKTPSISYYLGGWGTFVRYIYRIQSEKDWDTAGNPQSTSLPSVVESAQRACEKDRQRWLDSSARARSIGLRLQVMQNILTEVDRQYEATRLHGFFSATADLSTIAVTAYWKAPSSYLLTHFLGSQAAKEALAMTLKWKLIDAALKSAVKASFKSFAAFETELNSSFYEEVIQRAGGSEGLTDIASYMQTHGFDFTGAMTYVAKKSGIEVAKKSSMEFIKYILQGLGNARLNVEQGANISAAAYEARQELIKNSFTDPIGDTFSILLSTYFMVDGMQTSLDKLQTFRDVMYNLRQDMTLARQKLEQEKEELELARAAYDHCLALYPEAREELP